jgi:hypothetical protein
MRRLRGDTVSVSFIARIAVKNARSHYAIQLTDPRYPDPGAPPSTACGSAGTGTGTDADIAPGQRITLTIEPGLPCHGVARGIVELVIEPGPQDAGPPASPRVTSGSEGSSDDSATASRHQTNRSDQDLQAGRALATTDCLLLAQRRVFTTMRRVALTCSLDDGPLRQRVARPRWSRRRQGRDLGASRVNIGAERCA